MNDESYDYSLFTKTILSIVATLLEAYEKQGKLLPDVLLQIKDGIQPYIYNKHFDLSSGVFGLNLPQNKIKLMHDIVAFELIRLWVLDIPRISRPPIGIDDMSIKINSNQFIFDKLKKYSNSPEILVTEKKLAEKNIKIAGTIYNKLKNSIVYKKG